MKLNDAYSNFNKYAVWHNNLINRQVKIWEGLVVALPLQWFWFESSVHHSPAVGLRQDNRPFLIFLNMKLKLRKQDLLLLSCRHMHSFWYSSSCAVEPSWIATAFQVPYFCQGLLWLCLCVCPLWTGDRIWAPTGIAVSGQSRMALTCLMNVWWMGGWKSSREASEERPYLTPSLVFTSEIHPSYVAFMMII